MNKETIKNGEEIHNENQIVERISLFDGAINVPANQEFKHKRFKKTDLYNIYNSKFNDLVDNPIITEKTMDISNDGFYTFKVDKNATKKQITHALEVMFGIAVVSIKTIRTGQQTAHWNRKKKKKNIKKDIEKKALVKFNPDVELNMEKVQSIMENRQKIMRG